jgi:hypothetical protein
MLTTTEAHAYMGFMLTSISRFQRGLLFLTDGQIINARMGICQYPIKYRVAANIRMVPQNTHSSSVIVRSPLSCPV